MGFDPSRDEDSALPGVGHPRTPRDTQRHPGTLSDIQEHPGTRIPLLLQEGGGGRVSLTQEWVSDS